MEYVDPHRRLPARKAGLACRRSPVSLPFFPGLSAFFPG